MKPPIPRRPAPPAWAVRFLEWYCNPGLLEEIQGDLNEAFHERVAAKGLTRARLLFILDVFRFIRPFTLHREPRPYAPHLTGMLSNYSKIAWRNLAKNKVYSAINITGLSIGLACCLTIGLYIWDELSYDRFHPHGAHLYRVVEKQNQAGTLYDVAVTPGPLAPALKTNFAEVARTCRVGRNGGVVQVGTTKTEPDDILVVDNSFFSLFDFKLLRGNVQTVLREPGDAVITEAMAERLFGPGWRSGREVLGRQITLNQERTLTLAGIAANPPTNSHIQFDVLLSVRYDETTPPERSNYQWGSNMYHTYIRLHPDAPADRLSQKLEQYLGRFDPAYRTTLKTTLHLQPLYDIYLHSHFAFHSDWSKTSSMMYIRIFGAVGLVVLLIAVFNFINLSTARAVQRAREVGIRKAVGAFRGQLVVQFLGESLLMTGLATGLALLLLQLFLPLLNDIAAKSLSVPYPEPRFWLVIAGVISLVSVLAGLYPAFYLSRFRPVRVLKGVFDVQSGQLFRRTLVVGQFALSIILVTGAIVIYTQLRFLQDKNLGFDQSQLVQVRLRNELHEKAGLFKSDLQRQASIAGVTVASNGLVDLGNSTLTFNWEGQAPGAQLLITHLNADPDFLGVAGMKLAAGRNFDARIATDTSTAYLINETAARSMGWTPAEALGKKIKFWDREGSVIGVVQDFHFRPLTAAIEPFLFHYWPNAYYSHLIVKTTPGQTRQALAAIERFHKKHEHLTALQYEFVDDALENQYRAQQRTGRVVLYFSALAIFVSCLGLLGLATFTAEQRTKEIGIRKVLGASVTSIVTLLSKDFLKLVLVAFVIASPVAWYAAHRWLQDFAYKTDVQWWMFAGAGLLAVGIALSTVSYQAIKAALVKPVKSLRTE